MRTQTLLELVKNIKIKRVRHTKSFLTEQENQKNIWSSDQQYKFYQLMEIYGSDYGLLLSYFPNRNRKQIQRKYREIYNKKWRALEKAQQKRIQQRKKSYFDQKYFQSDSIDSISKPNNSDGSISSEEI